MLPVVVRIIRLAPVLLSLMTCARRATPQAGAVPAPRTAVTVRPDGGGVVASSADWTIVHPGLRWRRATLVDEGHRLDWVVARFDLATVTPSAEHSPDDHLASLAANPAVLFAVDAGFFTEDLQPSGTLISRGIELGAASSRGGSGVLVIRGGHAEILDSTLPLAPAPGIDLAVQCGPRLVERDGTVGIRRDDGRRFARTGACLRDGGRTLDVVITWWHDDPLRGPSLFDFAQRLATASPVGDPRGCEAALNLDGGPSTGMFVRGAPEASHDPIGPVPYALTVHAVVATH